MSREMFLERKIREEREREKRECMEIHGGWIGKKREGQSENTDRTWRRSPNKAEQP